MDDIERHFANAVKFHRKRLGLSQEAFAHKSGIHRTYASSIERGRVQVSIAIASQLAAALEIPLSKLVRDMERFAKGELSDDSSN
ncbi:MAG: helix-turn-helix transcriptional regulator [Planctomycetaceae bacterium]